MSPAKVMSACQANWRMALFVAICLYLIGYPTYLYLDSVITGGISRHGDLIVVDLKSMSDFEMNQIDGTSADIPERFRDLEGKRVMLGGEMWVPNNAAGELGKFDLVYSISKCCFSGPPKIQHFVKATVAQGRRVEYHEGLVNVLGTLHVGVQSSEGRVQSVYRVDVERVDPA